jgi:hypothetical protein
MVKTETQDDQTVNVASDIEWTLSGDFFPHGANPLLMRQLVIDNYVGCIQTWTCNINGEILLSQHLFQNPDLSLVFNDRVKVQQVDLLLISKSGKVSKTSSFFLSESGCLLNQFDFDTTNTIHLNPFSDLPPRKSIKDLHVNWKNDIQLMTMYLDYKAKRKDELKKFVESPRVSTMLRDYVVCLVKSKPQSVMNFTMDFVKNLERDANAQQVYQTAARRHQQN